LESGKAVEVVVRIRRSPKGFVLAKSGIRWPAFDPPVCGNAFGH
jgi:hypothetical protein